MCNLPNVCTPFLTMISIKTTEFYSTEDAKLRTPYMDTQDNDLGMCIPYTRDELHMLEPNTFE